MAVPRTGFPDLPRPGSTFSLENGIGVKIRQSICSWRFRQQGYIGCRRPPSGDGRFQSDIIARFRFTSGSSALERMARTWHRANWLHAGNMSRHAIIGVLRQTSALKAMRLVENGHQICPFVRNTRLLRRQDLAGTLKVGGSIDTQRHRVNDSHIDAHAILQAPQLLSKRIRAFEC